jgi:serine/threonine protein phosphatase 1
MLMHSFKAIHMIGFPDRSTPIDPSPDDAFRFSWGADALLQNLRRFKFDVGGAANLLPSAWRLFRGQQRQAGGADQSFLPAGCRVYAIGDIHGRADLLECLAEQIWRDVIERPCESVLTIFLGDYVDRGPDSATVIDRLASNNFPTSFIPLRGNHEAVMLQFLEDESVLDKWRHFGGVETLASYNVEVTEVMRGRGFKAAQDRLRHNLPDLHREFLEQTCLSYTLGEYFFCHAGVRPGVALDQQDPRDLLWIRDEFLGASERFGKTIVHGHNAVPTVEILPNRINADTGAYATNVLTAVVLEGGDSWILDTADGAALSLTNG